MKIGFFFRKLSIESLEVIRSLIDMALYLAWLLLDPGKFKIIDNKKIKNILVVYAGAIGDTYNTLGIINSLVSKYKYLNIYYLSFKKNKDFIKNPNIHIVNLDKAKTLIDDKKIDAAVFLTNILESDLFDKEFYLKTLKVPYIILSAYSSIVTLPKQIPFSITRRVFPRYKSMLGIYISAFEKLGFYFNKKIDFFYTKEAEKYAESFFKKIKKDKREKIIFFHPFSSKITHALDEGKIPSSNWPNERWSELANIILSKYNSKIVFTGSKEEKELIASIISKIKQKKKIFDLSGKISIEDAASLLKRADLLISVDTSMAHIGAQTGVPLIDLMFCKSSLCGPHTNKKIELFHPEVCNNCRRYSCSEGNNICMKSISVKEAEDAADFFISAKKKNL